MGRGTGKGQRVRTVTQAPVRGNKRNTVELVARHWKSGRRFANQGDLTRAVEELKKALALDSHQPGLRCDLGQVYERMGASNEALQAYLEELMLHPSHVNSANNAGCIYAARGDLNNARKYFEQALHHRPGDDNATRNLRLLNQTNGTKPPSFYSGAIQEFRASRLSLCMIVKNEEKHLPGCLKSVEGVVDEIIVVDTGSTDETVNVARSCGAKVHVFPWTNDFAAARNESLRHATGDWILYLDADERIAEGDGDKVRQSIANSGDLGAFLMRIVGKVGAGEDSPTMAHTYPRLFRNAPELRFVGAIHEQIAPAISRAGYATGFCDAIIDHLGYAIGPEEEKAKFERNLALLLGQQASGEDGFFLHFNLGRTYIGLKRYEEGLRELNLALEYHDETSSDRLRANAYAVRGQILLGHKNDVDGAIASIRRSLDYDPNLIRAYRALGDAYSKKDDHEAAAKEYRRALEVFRTCSERRDLFDNEVGEEESILLSLAVSEYKAGTNEAAVKSFEELLSKYPNRQDYYYELGDALRSTGDLERILDAFLRYVECSPASDRKATALYNAGVACIKLNRKDEAEKHLRAALEISPDSMMAVQAFVALLVDRGRSDEAMSYLLSMPESIASRSEVLHQRRMLARDMGRWPVVVEACQTLISGGEDSALIRVSLAQAFERLGNIESAVAHYERAVSIDSTYGPAWEAIGMCCARIGNLEMARECLRMAYHLGVRTEELLRAMDTLCVDTEEEVATKRYSKGA